jgi:hypothetical protein
MRRKIIPTRFLILIFLTLPAIGVPSDHVQLLNSKFPHGLIGDDHGILKLSDLAINACNFKSHAFPPEPFSNPYEYWSCFETQKISLKCEKDGFLQDTSDGPLALVVISAAIGQTTNHFIERRAWPFRDCKKFLKQVATLIKGTSHACISGSFGESEGPNRNKTHWFFSRIRTLKGCVGRDCDFDEKIKKEQCPDLKM